MTHRRSGPMLLATVIGAIILLGQAPAFAQTGYPPGPQAPTPGPQVVVFSPAPPTPVAAAPRPVPRAAPLVRTGTDVTLWTVVALALVGTGSVLYVLARRRSRVVA